MGREAREKTQQNAREESDSESDDRVTKEHSELQERLGHELSQTNKIVEIISVIKDQKDLLKVIKDLISEECRRLEDEIWVSERDRLLIESLGVNGDEIRAMLAE